MLVILIIFFSLCFFLFTLIFSRFQGTKHLIETLLPTHHDHGPTSYPIIGCLLDFYRNRGRLLEWYTDLLSNSPSQTIVVRRLGAIRTVVTANPKNVEYMLKTNFNNFPKGRPFTEVLGDLLGYGIFNVDGELWWQQRKLASHTFTTNSLREFVVKVLRQEVEERLLPVVEEVAERKRVIDLQELLRRLAFDVVCRVSLGIDPCCLDLSRPLPDLAKGFEKATEVCARRGMAPVYAVWKAKKVLNLGTERELSEAVKMIHNSVLEIVRNKKIILESRHESDQDLDLLSRLLLAGHGDEVVRDMVISFIIAGQDTTSSAMTWLFWLLSRNKNIEDVIKSEVNSILDNGEKLMHFETLKDMNYLKACLCESMRLYPPVAWDSKHAASDDVLPDGTFVRKGDRVTYFPYGMGRMEELWGKDRFEFKPDRWFNHLPINLESGIGGMMLKRVSPFEFPVFQAGPRVCLGKEMAFIQMKYVVASMIMRYKIRPVSEVDPVFVPLFTAHMAGGFKVVVKRNGE